MTTSRSADQAIIGVDIGGANLKAATTDRRSASCAFPLWKKPLELSAALEDLIKPLVAWDSEAATLSITMTGELADCFENREIGVRQIVDSVLESAGGLGVDDVWFYGVDGRFHSADSARRRCDIIAAANWHALASYVATEISPNGWLIDVGSTTCDIIRLVDCEVGSQSTTDFDRLLAGELLYVGCRRTPICSLVDTLTLKCDGEVRCVPVMNEVFATTDDVGLVLGETEPSPEDLDTADGMPRSIDAAKNRLARMVGLDHRGFSLDQARSFGEQIVADIHRRIDGCLERLQQDPDVRSKQQRSASLAAVPSVVLSGHGDWILPHDLATRLMPNSPPGSTVQLSDLLGDDLTRSAPAYAVAELRRRFGPSSTIKT